MHERLKATPTTWMSEILKKFPPVFHRWFLNRWKDRPAAWHGARTAFAHTAAVWSMVGHVVGLGDRHGENILLDQESPGTACTSTSRVSSIKAWSSRPRRWCRFG